MPALNGNRYQKVFIGLLVAVFFSSQAFRCCLVNHRLGRFIISSLQRHGGVSDAHSCCAAAHGSDRKKDGDTNASKSGCCIQDANQKLPQLASQQAPVPDMAGLVSALPKVPIAAVSLPASPDLQSRSSPPIYLSSLRLLI